MKLKKGERKILARVLRKYTGVPAKTILLRMNNAKLVEAVMKNIIET